MANPAAKTVAVLALLALTGCGPSPNMAMYDQTQAAKPAPIADNHRVTVTRIGVFRDDIAYDDTRGIYLIVDTKTGTEFIGISGVGITESSSHMVSTGKTHYVTEDER